MKKKIAEVPYDQMEFIWVSNHWDYHLGGLCRYNGELCEFGTVDEPNPDFDQHRYDTDDDYEEYHMILTCMIYKLSLLEKIKWKFSQKKFEWMVGYYWSYPARIGGKWKTSKPKWLRYVLHCLFYHKLNFKKWMPYKSYIG